MTLVAVFIEARPLTCRLQLEISRPETLNPIKQDVKKGALRYIHDPYPFNYGAFPQTWEDPAHVTPATNAKGDNDPLDVCEVGKADGKTGQIKQVKILGTWAMIDDGETDWKILVIDVNDPKAADIHDADSLEAAYPGTLKSTFEFLRDYKIPAGSGPNSFAFDNALKDREFALGVINETNTLWKSLFNKEGHEIALANTTQASHTISSDEAKAAAKL